MIIITKQEKIRNIAEAWKDQYYADGKWLYGEDKRLVYEALVKEQPRTEKEITRIIGNNAWTENICDECGRDVEVLVALGEKPNWGSHTACICEECLQKALALIKRRKEK